MKFSTRQVLIVAMLTLAMAASASAGPADHNNGFFLRLAGGGGYASTSINDPNTFKLELSGIGGGFSAAIGAMVKPNLALHGTVWGWLIGSPDAKINGTDAGSFPGNLNMSAIGGGATYYFMPANVYFTGNLGVGQLSTDGGSSDPGIVLDFGLGKEWWVSPKWGLGLNAGVNYHNVPDGGVSENWSGTSFVLNFSATMN